MSDDDASESTEGEFMCPICYDLLYKPVRSECGHTFCYHCLERWFTTTDGTLTCPLDRKHLSKLPKAIEEELETEIMAKHPKQYETRREAVTRIQAQLLQAEIRMVASRSCGNSKLVTNLKNLEDICLKDVELELALLQLPRGEFVPPQNRSQAYVSNQPLHVASLQFNVSAAHLHVYCLQELEIKKGEAFLDVGTGSGVVAALAAQLVKEEGVVHGIDLRSTVVNHAKRNIQVQRRRAQATLREREEYGCASPSGALVPGVVFSGSHDGHQFYLFIDSRESQSAFTGRFHWPNRGRTTTLCRGTLHSVPDAAYIDISLKECQILNTRYMWEQLTWVPLVYTLRWDGTTLSCGNFHAMKVCEQPLGQPPCLDNVSIHNANVFSEKDMKSLMALLPEQHREGYDKIHCGASCPEQSLPDLVKLLKVGGRLITPVESDLCLITRNEDDFSVAKKLKVRYGQLLTVEEQRELVQKEKTTLEGKARILESTADQVYYSKCCGLPLASKSSEVETTPLVGSPLDLDDGDGVLIASGGLNNDSVAPAEPSLVYYSQACLGSDVCSIVCKKCKRALGVTFMSEPLERQEGESWVGKHLLCGSYLRTDSKPKDETRVLKCCNGDCGNVICSKDQVLSTAHRWKLEGSNRSEAATYINAVEEGSVRMGSVSVQFLAQGRMKVAPMYCSRCDQEIGWHFVSHVCAPQRPKLIYYEGRHGLVTSRVTGLPNTEASMTRLLLQTILNRGQTHITLIEDDDHDDGNWE
eukprot:TRINITY_DN19732_c0_g1_i1.p1 TRINITY_DN19732_c0_g1~~TRINITY_DN19732_c0_g1_i1.p1  ORF type:complete len:764 (+),score=152.47 TRINITY_DN19732_c0_g1_i1:28-2292(+)